MAASSQDGTVEAMKANKKSGNILNVMVLIEYLLEYVALFDFVSDLLVVSILLNSRNTMWAAQLVLAMIAPLLVCSIQMIDFFLDKLVRRKK